MIFLWLARLQSHDVTNSQPCHAFHYKSQQKYNRKNVRAQPKKSMTSFVIVHSCLSCLIVYIRVNRNIVGELGRTVVLPIALMYRCGITECRFISFRDCLFFFVVVVVALFFSIFRDACYWQWKFYWPFLMAYCETRRGDTSWCRQIIANGIRLSCILWHK